MARIITLFRVCMMRKRFFTCIQLAKDNPVLGYKSVIHKRKEVLYEREEKKRPDGAAWIYRQL